MHFFFLFLLAFVHSTAWAASSAESLTVESNKLHFTVQGSQSQITLGSKSFSEYGIKPTVVFFPFRRLAFMGSYFAVIKPDGSSNLNGLSFGAKTYLFGPGTSSTLKGLTTSVATSPGLAYYLGMEFQSRDLRSNSINLNFTGFAYLAGMEWHFHRKWFAGLELSHANLKNALGASAVQDLTVTTLALTLGVMI